MEGMKPRFAPLSMFSARLVALVLTTAFAGPPVWGQTSPACCPPATPEAPTEEMPLEHYLALLQAIAPAAEAGARAYLAAYQQRCSRPMRTSELRRAISQGDGDPVLLGLIRASHLRDAASAAHWARQVRCPGRSAP